MLPLVAAIGDEDLLLLYSGNMGWSQPWGVSYGGMTGSDEINPFDGVEIADTASHAGNSRKTV